MQNNLKLNEQIISEDFNFKKEVSRYISFWPWFLFSFLICMSLSFLSLRYAQYLYLTQSIIEIIDESQDTEMALPTSLTVFNRSMINLENEVGILTSYSINERVVNKLNFNVRYTTIGDIKTTLDHPDEWFDDYEIEFKIDPSNVKTTFNFEIVMDEETKYFENK